LLKDLLNEEKVMKSKSILLVAIVLFLCAWPAFGTLYLNDGLTHDIDYEVGDHVKVDYLTPDMYTTVNVLDGANMKDPYELYGYENSRINIRGGHIDGLRGYGFSQVDITGGSVGWLLGFDSSRVNITGGSINDWLQSIYSNQTDIFGGSIESVYGCYSGRINIYGSSIHGELRIWGECIIKIFGSGFAVDGQPFGYGELTNILGVGPWGEPTRRLTGTLLSGEFIDNDFYVGDDARIVLIPEPATLLLLGLGGMFLKRRRI
jgi:hypothetical protein